MTVETVDVRINGGLPVEVEVQWCPCERYWEPTGSVCFPTKRPRFKQYQVPQSLADKLDMDDVQDACRDQLG